MLKCLLHMSITIIHFLFIVINFLLAALKEIWKVYKNFYFSFSTSYYDYKSSLLNLHTSKWAVQSILQLLVAGLICDTAVVASTLPIQWCHHTTTRTALGWWVMVSINANNHDATQLQKHFSVCVNQEPKLSKLLKEWNQSSINKTFSKQNFSFNLYN